MQVRALLLALLLLAMVLPLPTHGDMGDCSGAPPIRLATGVTARTVLPNGTPLYASPGERFRRTTTLRRGAALYIVGGPICSDSMQWWQVLGADGLRGWLPEGDTTAYRLEPWPVSIDVVKRSPDAIHVVRVKAEDGSVRAVTSIPIKPVSGSVRRVFPPAEWGPLEAAFNMVLAHCPLMLTRSDAAYANAQGIDGVPADSGAMDVYPSPDGIQVLAVRHLWHSLVACTAEPLPVYGVDRVSLMTAHADTTLLDIPANASSPPYQDRFPYQKQETAHTARSRIEGVWWSPDGQRVLLSIRYTDFNDPTTPVFTYKVAVYDLRSGTLTDLGDGRAPAWDASGERVQWFRLIAFRPGVPPDEILYTANPDGSDLRDIPLPAGISFIAYESGNQPFVTWDAPGERVMGCVQDSGGVCTAVASFDLTERQLSPLRPVDPLLQVKGYRRVVWVNSDTLLWLPADPNSATLYVQDVAKGRITPIHLASGVGSRLSVLDAASFADGKSMLVTLRDSANALRYVIVNAETAQVIAVSGL
jgi:hypothetical protein